MVTILSGGMGHLLRRRGVAIEGPIGSMQRFLGVALANTQQPEVVEAAHREYLDAGATIITTNSYSCVPAALELLAPEGPGVSPSSHHGDIDVTSSITAACEQAEKARAGFLADASAAGTTPPAPIRIAGCIPPLHETYRYDKVGSDEEMAAAYAHIVHTLAPHCDLLLIETMSSLREARAAALAAAASGLPVWVAWTLHEDGSGNLRSSEPIDQAVAALADVGTLEACLFNCCSHQSIVAALPVLRALLPTHVAVGAYANGFETVAAGAEKGGAAGEYLDLSPAQYHGQCAEYVAMGAAIVGGCCGVFPEHIRELRALRDGE